ncbi:MAG: PfkB family carbohydrate kinase, partial [Pseudomonas sp.]
MDISTYAAPLPPRQSVVTRRLAVAVGALFVTGVIAAAVALLGIANKLDKEEVRKTEFYSVRALENRITASKNYITSYAYWTTAYERLSDQVDTQWAYTEQNLGNTLFTADGAWSVPAQAREVFDVSGAGDTVIAVLATMIATGHSLQDAVA